MKKNYNHQISKPVSFNKLRFNIIFICLCTFFISCKDEAIQRYDPNQIENRKLALEVEKKNQQWIIGLLPIFTILATAAVAYATIKTNVKNARDAARIQARLKAIDVVISAAGPNTAEKRLILVNSILGPENRIDGERALFDGVGQGHDQSRKELIKMLTEPNSNKKMILDLWYISFGRSSLKNDIKYMREYFDEGTLPNYES